MHDIAPKQTHTHTQNVAVTTPQQEAKSYWLHSAQLLPVFPAVVVYAAFRDPAKELSWHHALKQANTKNAFSQFRRIPKGVIWRRGVESLGKSLPKKKKLAGECKAVSEMFLLLSK